MRVAVFGHSLPSEHLLLKSPLRPCCVLDALGVRDGFAFVAFDCFVFAVLVAFDCFVFAVLVVSGDFVLDVFGVPDGLALGDQS